MRHLLTLFALVFTLQIIAGDSILGDKWRNQVFFDSCTVSRRAKGNDLQVKIDKSSGRKCVLSVYQNMPEFDPNGKMTLKFQARSQAAEPNYLVSCISASPGANPPCTRDSIGLKKEWQECTFTIPLSGLNKSSVFEFIWEGMLNTGEMLEIKDISLTVDDSNACGELFLTSPGSRVLLRGISSDMLGGRLHPLKRYDGGKWVISVRRGDEVVLSVSGIVKWPETLWQLNSSALPDGEYRVVAEVSDRAGNKGEALEVGFLKAKPSEVNSYVHNGTLYYQGKPFIPLGLYHAGLWNMNRANDVTVRLGKKAVPLAEQYREIAAHGFNTLHSVLGPHGEDYPEFNEYAKANNLLIVPQMLNYTTGLKLKFTPDSNIIGYYGLDEASGGEASVQARQMYGDLKVLAPRSVIFCANYATESLELMEKTSPFLDVFLYDKYVIREKDTDLTELSQGMKEIRALLAGKPEIVFGFTPQAFIYNGPEPTPEQLRAQIYLGILNGARAFVYYSYNEDYGHLPFDCRIKEFPSSATGMSLDPARKHWWLPASLLYDEMTKLNAEIRDLSDFILNTGTPIKVSCNNRSIDLAAKEVNGVKYLIAVNMTARPATAAIKSTILNQTLEFAPYEAKVFKF